jgi:hypothetical protein
MRVKKMAWPWLNNHHPQWLSAQGQAIGFLGMGLGLGCGDGGGAADIGGGMATDQAGAEKTDNENKSEAFHIRLLG